MINDGERLGTADVAARLGVKAETVYAYVSRGLLHSARGPGGSTFDPTEVERVARAGRRGDQVSRSARDLSFVTRLTLIDQGRLLYRGRDAVGLSRQWSFEDVAWYLWAGGPLPPPGRPHPSPQASADGTPRLPGPDPWVASPPALAVARSAVGALGNLGRPIDRLRVAVAAAATADPLRHDRSASTVSLTGRSLLAVMVDSLPDLVDRTSVAEGTSGAAAATLAGRLWRRLTPAAPTAARVALLDAALVLVADHELAASTLAARVAASFRADPYAVVGAGLGPAGGPLHSGASGEVRDLLAQSSEAGAEQAVGRLLDRDAPLPGFGLPLYPDGDPRATELLRLLATAGMPDPRREVVAAVLALGARRASPPPNVDFALGAVEWGLEMIPGAGQAIFVVGRSAGWLAHAIEEYQERSTFRVRAAYVGPR